MLCLIAIAAFFWAVGSGQFDDLESPAMSVVMDDDTKPATENRRQADPQKDKKGE